MFAKWEKSRSNNSVDENEYSSTSYLTSHTICAFSYLCLHNKKQPTNINLYKVNTEGDGKVHTFFSLDRKVSSLKQKWGVSFTVRIPKSIQRNAAQLAQVSQCYYVCVCLLCSYAVHFYHKRDIFVNRILTCTTYNLITSLH